MTTWMDSQFDSEYLLFTDLPVGSGPSPANTMSWLDMRNTDDTFVDHGCQSITWTNAGTAPVQRWSGPVRYFDGSSTINSSWYPTVGRFCIGAWVKFSRPVGNRSGWQLLASCVTATDTYLKFGLYNSRLCCEIKNGTTAINSTATVALLYGQFYFVTAYYESASSELVHIAAHDTNGNVFDLGAMTTGSGVNVWGSGSSRRLILGGENSRFQIGDFYYLYNGASVTASQLNDSLLQNIENDRLRYSEYPQPLRSTWLPMLADSFRDARQSTRNQYCHIRSGENSPETFVQVGNILYMSPDEPAASDYIMRWDGFSYTRGTCESWNGGSHATGPVFKFDTDLASAGILPGDTIYFLLPDSDSVYRWHTDQGLVIKSVSTFYATTYAPSGVVDGAGTAIDVVAGTRFVIVRLHRAGVKAPTGACAKSTDTSGNVTGDYRWAYRYYKSTTGYAGNLSADTGTISVSSKSVTLTGWETDPTDLAINKVQVYRSESSGGVWGPWYLAVEISRSVGVFASTAADNTATLTEMIDSDYLYHAQPPALGSLAAYNNRLWGAKTDEPNWAKFSTLDSYEYFPIRSWSPVDAATLDLTGGEVQIGDASTDRILSFRAEGSTYINTGNTGSNMLILLTTGAYRLFGYTRNDFSLQYAFADGGVSPRCVTNASGRIAWIGRDHIYALDAGSMMPQHIENAIFRNGLRASVKPKCLPLWRIAYWNGWLLVLGTLAGTRCDTLWMLKADQAIWTSATADYNDVHVMKNVAQAQIIAPCGTARTISVSGEDLTCGDIYSLFDSETTPRATSVRLGALALEQQPTDMLSNWNLYEVTIRARASVAQPMVITARTYSGEDTASVTETAIATMAQATEDRQWKYTKFRFGLDSRIVQLDIGVNAVWPFELESVILEYRNKGDKTVAV